MQFKTLLAFLPLVAATPVSRRDDEVKSMMADLPEWTIKDMARYCDTDDTVCSWKFSVDTNVEGVDPTPCVLKVFAADDSTPASQSNGGPATCGVFTVTSGWSGQFGPGQGFTVLSVVDYAAGLIVWPGYADHQIENGVVVKPDQSYQPVNLP